ncbi:MAG: MBL fold metallo-hydrolase [Anaerolineae bacterium]|jgi:glyoxylase-like metal-dependent hydrolase (beta-lactamase superfamily II)
MRFGNCNLHVVSDGVYWEDGGGLFGLVPKALWSRIVQPDELNRVMFEMRCLLIETEEQRILVDTGFGDKLSEKARKHISLEGEKRLLGSLEALGIGPLDIDLVINTHLHEDHCGGNTCYDQEGHVVPTFPWATYCVQRQELADASYPNERTRGTYRAENFRPLQDEGRLQILWGNSRLTDEVRVVVTPGHTRAHQCVVIESGGETAMFLGDLASWPVHMERLAWVPAYDLEPMVSIETKRNLAHWAVENHVLLFFEHHPEIVAGHLHTTERPDRFRLEPVSVAD